MQGLLQRGHTIDRLSPDDLQKVVAMIDQLHASKPQPSSQPSEPTQDAPSSGTPKRKPSSPKSSKKSSSKKPKLHADATAGSNEVAGDKLIEVPKETTVETKEADTKPETKQERKKRLHARYMRFSRSLVSS